MRNLVSFKNCFKKMQHHLVVFLPKMFNPNLIMKEESDKCKKLAWTLQNTQFRKRPATHGHTCVCVHVLIKVRNHLGLR